MKTTILIINAIVLLFTLMGVGCEKEEAYEVIPLEYVKCPCASDLNFIKKITIENILLFDSAKTSWDEMKTQTFNGDKSEFCSFSGETKNMIYYSFRTTMTGSSYVCNVPAEIKDWTISSTGVVISFSADEFESCMSQSGIANNTFSNCVLKTFKRKIK